MVKIRISTRILASFGIILAAMLAVGLFIHGKLSVIEEHALSIRGDAVAGLYQSSLIKDALGADDLHALTGKVIGQGSDRMGSDEAAGQQAEDAATLTRLIADYEKTIFTEDDRQAFTRFKSDLALYQSARAHQGAAAPEVRARFNAAFADIAAVTTLNQRNALARIEDIDGQIRSLLVSLSLGFLLALLVALTAGTMLLRVIQAAARADGGDGCDAAGRFHPSRAGRPAG
jgi:hypothetical protein